MAKQCYAVAESFNPFSGGFIIASHIYKGKFPLSLAGI
jgi:hypothetical protein